MSDLPPASPASSPFDAIRRVDEDGNEYWSARDLMAALDYESWRNFEAAIKRAEAAAINSGSPANQFVQVAEVVAGGNLGPQTRIDYRLTRYAAYLLMINGDPHQKPKVAEAQRYFATKTREAEVQQAMPTLPQTYAEALRELAASVEEREQLAQQVATLTPAASSWEQLVAEGGDHLVGDIAKVLKRAGIDTGPTRLYKSMHEFGWVYRTSEKGPWRAKQRAVDAGWLVHRLSTGSHERRNGETRANPPQVRITAKGIAALHAKMSRAALELVVGGEA
jgi:DNA-damage-inducible protein D